MNITNVFTVAPVGYQPTLQLAWVEKQGRRPFDDDDRLLAQMWECEGQPDMWIAIPEVYISRNQS